MDDNLAVVEVKPATVSVEGIRADLRKLFWFCQNARYYRRIFVVYGEAPFLAERLQTALAPEFDTANLRVFHHAYVGMAPQETPI